MIIGVLVILLLGIVICLLNDSNILENFENGNAHFDSRDLKTTFFKEISGLPSINSEIDTGPKVYGDPNKGIILKLQKIILISISPIDKDDDFVKKSLQKILEDFNSKEQSKFSLLDIGVIREKIGGYEFNAFISEFDTLSTVSVKINLLSDGSKVISLKSNFIADSGAQLNTVQDNTNKINDSLGFYKIKNNLGLFFPYPTSEDELLLTAQIKLNHLKRIEDSKKQDYLCFGIDDIVSTEAECVKLGGTWDTPVTNNFDCPYFESNKNYRNEFGGTKNGYCDNPSGLQSLGYRYTNKDQKKSTPLCYNCKTDLIGQGSLGRCCEAQKLDPRFASPDYKFNGDYLDRKNAKDQLNLRGLSID
jgi:hypothetical protein